jgi:hypothetical protein
MLNLDDELWTKYASTLGKRTYALYQTAIMQYNTYAEIDNEVEESENSDEN